MCNEWHLFLTKFNKWKVLPDILLFKDIVKCNFKHRLIKINIE